MYIVHVLIQMYSVHMRMSFPSLPLKIISLQCTSVWEVLFQFFLTPNVFFLGKDLC